MFVMAGLVPAIHVLLSNRTKKDARHKAGHDGTECTRDLHHRPEHRSPDERTRNPGSLPRSFPDAASLIRATGIQIFKKPYSTWTQLRDLAAHAREFCRERSALEKSEGAGNAGRQMRPQPRVWCVESTRVSHHGHTGITRHSPRNGFNGFLRALPSDRAFLPLSPRGYRRVGPLGPTSPPRSLTPASGRQDHTTSPSADRALVNSAACVHRISCPRP
jgi:hypothetical protein